MSEPDSPANGNQSPTERPATCFLSEYGNEQQTFRVQDLAQLKKRVKELWEIPEDFPSTFGETV